MHLLVETTRSASRGGVKLHMQYPCGHRASNRPRPWLFELEMQGPWLDSRRLADASGVHLGTRSWCFQSVIDQLTSVCHLVTRVHGHRPARLSCQPPATTSLSGPRPGVSGHEEA